MRLATDEFIRRLPRPHPARWLPSHSALWTVGQRRAPGKHREGPQPARRGSTRGHTSGGRRGHSSHTARAMPLLWRADAYCRGLPSRAKAAITGTTIGAGRMMKRASFPSTRHWPLLRCRGAGACPGLREYLEIDRFRYDQASGAPAFSAKCFRRASQSHHQSVPNSTAAATVGALSP